MEVATATPTAAMLRAIAKRIRRNILTWRAGKAKDMSDRAWMPPTYSPSPISVRCAIARRSRIGRIAIDFFSLRDTTPSCCGQRSLNSAS